MAGQGHGIREIPHVNLRQYKELLRPATVSQIDWDRIWEQFESRFRDAPDVSVFTLASAVRPEVLELQSVFGTSTASFGELLGYMLLQATGALTPRYSTTALDLAMNGGPVNLSLSRAYDASLMTRNRAGAFGNGWTFNFDISAISDKKGNVVIYNAGATQSFTRQADGTFVADLPSATRLTVEAGAYVLTGLDGSVVRFRPDGRLGNSTDANGNVVTATWSSINQLTKLASSTGQFIVFTYTAQGRIASATDSTGRVATYTYDTSGTRLLAAATSQGTTSYAYKSAPGTASDNALISIANADGTHRFFGYGTNGRLTTESGDGNSENFTYDYSSPGTVGVTDGLGHKSTIFYDVDGNPVQIVDPSGGIVRLERDAAGNLTKLVTPAGNTSSFTYDPSGAVTGFTDPLKGTVSLGYDSQENLVSLTDQRGNVMTYGRDAHGNLTSIGYEDGKQTGFTYKPGGLLKTVTNARNQTNTLSHDAAGHVTGNTFSDGTSETFTYDGHGNLTSATARDGGTTTYAYDGKDNLVSVRDALGRTESFAYDGGGRRVERVDPDGTVTRYTYDAAGHLHELKDGSGNVLVTYAYDIAGQLTRVDNRNGTSTTYAYDVRGNVTEIRNLGTGGTVLSRESYTYTADSQMATKATLDGSWAYSYDKAGQLVHAVFTSTNSAIANQDLTYIYDAAGNRVRSTVNGVVTSYVSNDLNQYTSATGTKYTYDADGNLTKKVDSSGTWTYSYDIEGQLTAVTGPDGSSWAYKYDALGYRIASTHDGVTETYVVDPTGIGTAVQTYTAAGNVSATYVYGYGLALQRNGSSTSFYTSDVTGNITGLTNGAGALTDNYFYDPYGDSRHLLGTSDNSFLFSGSYGVSTDGTSLSYMRARYFDGTDGRFVARDPININGGLNVYAYTANDPLNRVDPTGFYAGDVSPYWRPPVTRTYTPQSDTLLNQIYGWIRRQVLPDPPKYRGWEPRRSTDADGVRGDNGPFNFPDGFPGGGGTFNGSPGDGSGFTQLWCCVSIDETGRWVAYESPSGQIASGDTNGKHDIFLYQLKSYVYPIGTIQRVSINARGEEGNGDSFNPDLSGDGNSVAYTSFASNLVDGDTNGVSDILLSGIDIPPRRVSVASDGSQANGASYFVSVSYDAGRIAFVSEATNLVAGDTNGVSDIFLRNVQEGTTELVSQGLGGAPSDGASTMPAISGDGMLVAFVSAATNLVAGDTNGFRDILLRDRTTGVTTLITQGLGGTGANGDSWAPVITRDGRYVAFFSSASNLVAGDTNGKADVFLADRAAGTIQRVSVGLGGAQANGDSGGKPVTGPFPGNAWGIALSSDGRFISFISQASNLVAGDTNGKADVFLYDRESGLMSVVDKSDSGQLATGGPNGSLYAGAVAMSGDASIIAYISDATNLVASDKTPSPDVFIYQTDEPISPAVGLAGGVGRNAIVGLDGNETLHGGEGDDLMSGGGGNDTLFGEDGSDFLDGGTGIDRLVGGSGDDSYVVDDPGDRVIERAGEGQDAVATALNGYVLPGYVEELHLLGSADLSGVGNGENNLMFGNAGANLLSGGNGSDAISGDDGSDQLRGDAGDDRLFGQGGDDQLFGGTGDDALDGGDGDDQLFGNAGQDILVGGAGNDKLDGAAGEDSLDGGLGADTMSGGAGADTYKVDNAGDVVIETSNVFDRDTINASISYVLPKYVEMLVLAGGAIDGTGNALGNVITGNDLANTLDGGTGADQLIGGKGNDIYVVDSQSDLVQEDLAAGIDIVRSSVTYALAANVENLVLAGSDDLGGTGNELANSLTGNAGDNVLDGGLGADKLDGGMGDDTYFVDNAGDVVSEAADAGHDLIESRLSAYTLSANVEDLWLYWTFPDTTNRSGTGNDLGNMILGNGGVNTLRGLGGNDYLDGGAGKDTLIGGTGDDTYIVDALGEVVTEGAGEGIDTVISSVSFTLGVNVENLTLTGFTAINGTGNALANTLTGSDGDNQLDGGTGADLMIGGGGNDTYVVDNAADQVVEADFVGIDTVKASVSWTLGNGLENLVLTGTAGIAGTGNALGNLITGNAGSNVLMGLAGDDTLDGGLGADTMSGGVGSDTYMVDNAGDVVIETGASDQDTINASVSYVLPKYVEMLVLTGTAVTGAGNALANRIVGNDLGNTLDGGAGVDQLTGGKGNDIYIVDNLSDFVEEDVAAGTDIVRASVTYALAANVENLVLVGSDDLGGTGNELANSLTGNAGDNVLDGGLEADSMAGGLGDDTYFVDNAGDVVSEVANAGRDLIESRLSAYTLSADVEDLWLYWTFPDTTNRSGTGNDLGNMILGNGGVNTLRGLGGNDYLDGGAGKDTLIGGTGDDTYIVDALGEVVTEGGGEGTDTVLSSVSFTLGVNVENLTLTGFAAINGTGNALANTLTGNDANNQLDGGIGADLMIGGGGNDTYIVDNAADQVVEALGGGTDSVTTAVDFSLASGSEIESLRAKTGSTGLVLRGNEFDNILVGGSGNDTLDGDIGRDSLTGGAGADSFLIDDPGPSTGPDTKTIVDFAHGVDRLVLSDAGFDLGVDEGHGAALLQAISASLFSSSTDGSFVNAGTRFAYDVVGRALYYDADGSGAANSAQVVATFNTRITASDLYFSA